LGSLAIKKRKWKGRQKKHGRKTNDLLETDSLSEARIQAKLRPAMGSMIVTNPQCISHQFNAFVIENVDRMLNQKRVVNLVMILLIVKY
jgi:hypothetical protein